jgi:hypothetical protein
MVKHNAPRYALSFLVKVHNAFHQGSGTNFWDLVDEALDLEKKFAAHFAKLQSMKRGVAHDAEYHEFVRKNSDYFVKRSGDTVSLKWRPFMNVKSLGRSLLKYDRMTSLRTWSLYHVDYLNPKIDAHSVVSCMHAAVTQVLKAMGDQYYDKDEIGSMLETILGYLHACISCSCPVLASAQIFIPKAHHTRGGFGCVGVRSSRWDDSSLVVSTGVQLSESHVLGRSTGCSKLS